MAKQKEFDIASRIKTIRGRVSRAGGRRTADVTASGGVVTIDPRGFDYDDASATRDWVIVALENAGMTWQRLAGMSTIRLTYDRWKVSDDGARDEVRNALRSGGVDVVGEVGEPGRRPEEELPRAVLIRSSKQGKKELPRAVLARVSKRGRASGVGGWLARKILGR
jgi:hypothetical protein